MFECLFTIIRVLILDVDMATVKLGVQALRGQIHRLDGAIGAEDLHDVLLVYVTCQAPDVYFTWSWCWAPLLTARRARPRLSPVI